jgi:choice-of-anchor B domain-containing protein
MADIFQCENVDLVGFLTLAQIGGGSGNDLWGWTDPVTGHEYALVGRSNGLAFVDVSNPTFPVYVGNLPTHTNNSVWRDVKVYADHAFIVSDNNPGHGMQVFNLNQLRDVASPPVTFSNTAHYPGFGEAHNIVINEDSGFAYAVGSETCSGGLHMVDISTPASPVGAGCFSSDGYTHDAQCVIYSGPDAEHQGKEICFNSNEDTVTIVDVTNKGNPLQLSRTPYANSGYVHQGWLTEDQQYFIQDDEFDEIDNGHNTRTYTWDVSDLDAPVLTGHWDAGGKSIDHNQYVRGGYTYQANYRRGLRILELIAPETGTMSEYAYFDTYPSNDGNGFSGAWSVYPFFASGLVIVSDISRGLFILQPHFPGPMFEDDFETVENP